MKLLTRLALAIPFVIAGYGCSSNGTGTPIPETVSVDPTNSRRIRFVVHGDPGLKRYPEIHQLPLPMHEKIREGMRRYAADELKARSLCPNGFSGPEIVWAYESARLTGRFFVECL